jgi:hypothetical protein
MNLAKPALILIGLSAWSSLVMAQMIGNPVPSINDGQWAGGFSVESFSRNLSFDNDSSDSVDYTRYGLRADYGLSKNHALQLYLSYADADGGSGSSWHGPEIGGGYRQPIDITIPMGSKEAPTAVFADIRYGNLADGATFKYYQFDAGYGGSYPVLESLNAYAAVLVSNVYGRNSGRGGGDVGAVDHLGVMTGVEYSLNDKIRLTGELHVVHEIGIALLFQYFP